MLEVSNQHAGLRVQVVGTSGCGKSTLASRLAAELGLDHIELDELYWGPNWTPRTESEFLGDLDKRVSTNDWVVSGNYQAMTRDRILPRATHLVWLNYGRFRIGRQLLKRSIWRAATRKTLFGGCRESFRQSFASSDSVLLYAAKSFGPNRSMYRQLFDGGAYPHLQRVELRSRSESKQWLETIASDPSTHTCDQTD